MISKKEILVAAGLIALIAGMWGTVSKVDHSEQAAQTQMVRDAVQNAAISCYAVEGAYPSGLDYLKDHYGLAFDEDRYQVTYSAFASNLFPEIFVVEK